MKVEVISQVRKDDIRRPLKPLKAYLVNQINGERRPIEMDCNGYAYFEQLPGSYNRKVFTKKELMKNPSKGGFRNIAHYGIEVASRTGLTGFCTEWVYENHEESDICNSYYDCVTFWDEPLEVPEATKDDILVIQN